MKIPAYLAKILSDLKQYRGRFLMVQAALFLGLSGFGSILAGSSILNRELDNTYRSINPAAALVKTDPLTEEQRRTAAAWPGLGEANFNRTIIARILRSDGEWGELMLVVRPSDDPYSVNRIGVDSGVWPPAGGTMAIERSAVRMAGFKPGDTTEVRLPGGESRTVTIGGVIHDTWMPPAWMEGLVYGYATGATAAALGADPRPDTILVALNGKGDRAAITTATDSYAAWLADQGITVRSITVPEPGKHIHAGQMSALLFLMQGGGFLILFLAAVMIFTIMLGTIAEQKKQIGILKAVGGDSGQLTLLYLGLSLASALPATLLSLPGIWFGGRAIAAAFSSVLNFDLASRIPAVWVALAVPAAGLGVPLLAALIPVLQSTMAPALAFIRDGTDEKPHTRAFRLPLPAPLLLPVRNVFRKRTRAILTLSMMTLAGAIFLASLLVRVSVLNLLEKTFAASPYDAGITFAKRLTTGEQTELDKVIVPGGTRSWRLLTTAALANGSGKAVDPFPVYGGTSLYGVTPGGTSVVVNHAFADRYGPLVPGDRLLLTIGVGEISVTVKEITRESMVPPRLYMDGRTMDNLPGSDRFQTLLQVRGAPGSDPRIIRREVESTLANKGVPVEKIMDQREMEAIVIGHLDVILLSLTMITLVILAVGALGLSSVLGLSVLERRREIGVMRSQGATARQVSLLVMGEGIVYGLTGWLFASFLALPLGLFLGNGFAGIMLKQELPLTPEPGSFLLWLGISLAVSLLAALFPALDATAESVSSALGYE